MSGAPPASVEACATCAAPLAHDQRYCLECGTRRAGARRDVLALLSAGAAAGRAAPPPAGAPHRAPGLERRRRAALPVALATLVALVIASGTRAPSTFAGGLVSGLTVVLPAPAPAPAQVADAAAGASADPAPSDAGAVDGTTASSTSQGGDSGGGGGGDSSSSDTNSADTGSHSGDTSTGDSTPKPAIRHVWLVMLAQSDVAALARDPQAAPYLAGTLAPKGTLLTGFQAVARGELANEIALLSGQGPTQQTLADCPTYADVTPDKLGADSQQLGDGCLYPPETGTIADELHGAGKTWRAYVEDVGAGATGEQTCRHPAAGAADDLRDPRPGDAYATRRNPFAYFHSLLDGGDCARDDVGLDRLDADLARGTHAPALSYVAPNLCHDGRPTPCAPDAPAGPAAADAFLKTLVPRILRSKAYADGGLLVITSDGPAPPPAPAPSPPPAATTPTTPTTPQTTPTTPTTPNAAPPRAAAADASPPAPCCGLRSYPNVGDAGAAGAGPIVGALLISKRVRAGVSDATPANHFTLLRSLEDLFQLQPLGYAAAKTAKGLPQRVLPTAPS